MQMQRPSITDATDENLVVSVTLDKTDSMFYGVKSMTFTEVKIVTLFEKIINITKALRALFDQVMFWLPFWFIISYFLKIFLDWCTFIIRFWGQPLRVLIEAKEDNGRIALYMITDTRGWFSRYFRIGEGKKIEVAKFGQEDQPIFETKFTVVGCPGILCFCCCMCLWKNKLNLVRVDNNAVAASHVLYECCACNCCEGWKECFKKLCCKPFVTQIDGGDYSGKTKFYQARCACRLEGNVIEPKDCFPKVHALAVKRNTFSFKDFFLSAVDMLGDIAGNLASDAITSGVVESARDTLGGVIGEDAADAVATTIEEGKEAHDNIEEVRDTLKEFRSKGYQKIGTTKAKWEVTFKPNQTPAHKFATILFVIEQYLDRLS